MKDQYIFDEVIRLWYKCNEKCLFCNFTPLNEPWYKEKNLNDVKIEIDELILKYKDEEKISLSFSWWEPLLWWEELFDMIRYAKKRKIWLVWLQTNAVLITESIAFKLKELWVNRILVSLHSNKDSINDQITLLKNSATLALKGIENMKKAWLNFTINHVLNKINYKYFSEFVLFLKSININEVSLWIVQPHWYAEKNFNKIVVSYDDLYPFLKEWQEIALKNNFWLLFHYCDIPLCKYENKDIINNLTYKSLLEIRTSWIWDYWDFVKKLINSKEKTQYCKLCKYNNYCYWVWSNYIKYFWDNSIKPKNNYINYFEYLDKNNFDGKDIQINIEDDNIVFIHNNLESISDIKKSLEKRKLLIQYYITWEQFCNKNYDFFIKLIKNGVNALNLDLSNIEKIEISTLFKNINRIVKFSNQNLPHYDIVIFIKIKNDNLKQFLNLKFKNKIKFINIDK